MYIIDRNGRFLVSDTSENGVVALEAPAYRTELDAETEHLLSPLGGGVYADASNRAEITVEQKSDSLFYVRRVWTNTSDAPVRIQTILRVATLFAGERYLIPCVSVNGNEFGAGGEPKGLARDGKKWIFSYDRESIPACTLVENAEYAAALFASAESALALQSSCSLTRLADGRFLQELYHPVIEAPLTYCDRDKYSEACQTYIELGAGKSFACGVYLSVSRPRWENFGVCGVLDDALGLFGDPVPYPDPDEEKIWNNSITFAKSLISDYKGKKGFNIGYIPDGNGGFKFRGDPTFELAWCGQNVLFCRMLIEDYIRNGREDSLRDALEILDIRAELCTAENGLLASQLRDFENLNEACADTCNMGYGAYEFLRCWKRLQEIGIDKPAYLGAGKGLCDFFCDHFSEEYGFGKVWRLDGTCLDHGGSIGAFIIPALAKLCELTGEGKYLSMAERAMTFYVKRDLNKFVCTAGALDTCCVDKETATPFIIGATLLYELTGQEIYKTYAEKAAYYFTSWMFHYQPVYEEDSEVVRYGVQVKGLTSVSAQHHHLDMYAGLAVPYIRRLANMTGDGRWNIRAEMMWRSILQFIGDGEFAIHGAVRPVGSQNEALFHCHWGGSRSHCWGGERGGLNDWLVAWPCAFRLSVLAENFKATPHNDGCADATSALRAQ
ncbi:MAG: hypothetical protein E7610_02585 [Ruminococcaceae bacterium]|nr:hypothetical protein [Oscillospiraceae bacterium]